MKKKFIIIMVIALIMTIYLSSFFEKQPYVQVFIILACSVLCAVILIKVYTKHEENMNNQEIMNNINKIKKEKLNSLLLKE
jgi:membrane protein implicated in regulation of membrane protease activity